MDKIVTVFLATFLGILIIVIPLQLFPVTFQSQSDEILGEKDNSVISFPSSALHGGLVVLLGLTVALATFLYNRKRFH